jgi:probable F420-dependent oxidoreductase
MADATDGGRLGLTVPLEHVSLAEQSGVLDQIAAAGYTDLWSAEAAGTDAFTPLVAAAVTHPGFRLGTAIVPAYTRSPGVLAMSAAALADVARGEVCLGIGTSSDVIVERWNGIPFQRPYQRVRDVATFVQRALTGERVDMQCESFTISGFRLARVPARPPKLLLAALRPGMLGLAGRIADGAIINWLSADDVRTVVPHVRKHNPDAEIVARLFLIPGTDVQAVRAVAKRAITAYLTVPVYAEFHRWLGRAEVLEPVWQAWRRGDRAGAVAAVPDALVDELFLYGSPADVRDGIRRYVDAGVTTPVLAVLGAGGDVTTELAAVGRAVAAG